MYELQYMDTVVFFLKWTSVVEAPYPEQNITDFAWKFLIATEKS